MATKLLDETRIRALHQAAIEAGLASLRADLLRGLDVAFVASLPVSSSLSAQLFTDLHELCTALRDGSVPVVAWLKNAVLLAGGRAEVVVFEEALAHLGHPAHAGTACPPTSASASAPRSAPADHLDVVILAALHDELGAVLALGDGGRDGWEEKRDLQRFPYFRRTFAREDGSSLVIAAAWIGAMGQDIDTALRGEQLVAELKPKYLAICGTCSGFRREVALGDIVVADQLYLYDHGKLLAGEGPESGSCRRVEGYRPGRVWKMDTAFFARTFELGALTRDRPRLLAGQRAWLLRALHAQETEGAEAPHNHPDRRALCPAWRLLVPRLREEGLVAIKGTKLSLTDEGRAAVEEDLLINLDGLPSEAALRVHLGAMATGRTVQRDPTLFERLVRLEPTTIAVDMEGAAVAKVAASFGKRSLVVKAVSDHADGGHEDRYRAFACKASATFLLAFLLEHLATEAPSEDRPPPSVGASAHHAKGWRPLHKQHDAGFIARVEQVCRLRSPSALLQPLAVPPPFDGAVVVIVPTKPVIHLELLVALEHPITEEALAVLHDVLRLQRRNGWLSCQLVHLAPAASAELALRAQRLDVQLITFVAYQGLIDFSRYKAWLSSRLEHDTEYPTSLYVEQPASVSLSGQMPETVPSALARLNELLTTQERRFALILGDFGAGKSFLLRELARSLLAGDGSLIPVLVEMRYLEKQLSLRGLLAQHFGMANAGNVDIDAFLFMLHQGRVVLLFDGFDELAVRATFDQVLQHFAVITSAVEGRAKVIVSSRRQHFLDDGRVKLELARSAERLQGYRLVELQPFEEAQIRQFLRNRLKDESEADARYRLIQDVKDLLGLSHNPRMLSFIVDLERDRLERARDAAGEITPAKLYEVLLNRWLEGECQRTRVKIEGLWRAVRTFARKLWVTPGNAVDLGSLPRDLVPKLDGLKQALTTQEALLVLGSRSLLKRDAEGLFSFVHRSVLEWLVAGEAVAELRETGNAAVLDTDTMSPLMARFFVNLAGEEIATRWARRVFIEGQGNSTLQRNALQVAGELQIALAVDLEGQDLRGVNLAAFDLRSANLRGVNLEGVTLLGRNFAGADLRGARLARANLRGALLVDADLTDADLSFTSFVRADLSGAKLTGSRLIGAKLLEAKGLSSQRRAAAERDGAAMLATAATEEITLTLAGCAALAYHPGGHILATGHKDGTVRLWDTGTGHELGVLSGHSEQVWSVAFSPDGRSLASASNDTTVRLWNAATGRVLRMLVDGDEGVLSVAFSPDGRSLASASKDMTVRLWDTTTGHTLRTLSGHTDHVLSVAFSPDGRSLASASRDTTVRLWDMTTDHAVRTLAGHTDPVGSVAFSPDGRRLASASRDTTVRLWDTTTGLELHTLSGHDPRVWSVAFSPDGRLLASASWEAVRLWDAATGHLQRTLSGHESRVCSVAFSPDSRRLAAGSDDATVQLWDAATGDHQRTLSSRINGVVSVAFSPDGRSLAAGSEDRSVRLWDAKTGQQRRALSGHTQGVVSVAFSPDGRLLASCANDRTVRIWDAAGSTEQSMLSGNTEGVVSVAFSPDSRLLASGSADTMVRIWDVTTGRERRALSGHTQGVVSVVFSPDGRRLASGSGDRKVRLWNTATGEVAGMLSGHIRDVLSVAYSPDGRTLASGSKDTTVRLWDVATSKQVHALWGHIAPVWSVAFSPDGALLASASWDTTVRLWNTVTGEPRRKLVGHTARVGGVAFSPDGRSLASSSDDGTLRLWNTTSGRCFAVLLSTPEGWVSFVPQAFPDGPPRGSFKMGGPLAGSFWHRIGLARFELNELEEFLPEGQKLRLPDDYLYASALGEAR